MFEVIDDVTSLAVCERCKVWVGGEVSSSSNDSSIIRVWVEMADL